MAFTDRNISLLGPLRKMGRQVRVRLPELNFISLHYAYFIAVSLLSGLIFWGSSKPLHSISFIDSLFMCISAMTETGLNTRNLSEINTFQQVILFLLMLCGSVIAVSAVVVFIRLRAFESAFENVRSERLAARAKRKESGFSRAGSFVPWKLRRGTTLPTHNEKDESGLVLPKKTRPSIHNQEVMTRTTSSSETTAVEAGQTTRGRQAIAQQDFGGDEGRHSRGRTSQSGQDGPRTQCPSQSPTGADSDHEDHVEASSPHIAFAGGTTFSRRERSDEEYAQLHKPLFSFTGVGASNRSTLRSRSHSFTETSLAPPSASLNPPTPVLRRAATLRSFAAYDQQAAQHLTAVGWLSRNSQFHGLTLEEREKLGGKEYKSLVFLSFLVPLYFILWQGLGAISVGAYVKTQQAAVAAEFHQNAYWAGSFMAVSAFGNSGMSLIDLNMIAFQNSAFMLVCLGLFILAGNTAYPIFLRAAIWTMWKVIPSDDPHWKDDKDTLRFLLDHPRRVYTNLFPSRQTWWLFGVLVLLNGIDWAFFEILSIGDNHIENLSQTARVLGGLFQAFAVRCGGFVAFAIPSLRLSLQYLYVIMMYISVYPVTMTIRNSNVYEERSLGIFAEDLDKDSKAAPVAASPISSTPSSGRFDGLKRRMTHFAATAAPAPERETRSYFLRQQLRSQLAHDIWFVVLGVFLILIIENGQIERDPINFSAFNVVFEVVSAYASVGMSVGVPNNDYSFSGSWHTLSKLILCIVMLRGRHRGLPVAIDHAIQLPGSRSWNAEDEDGERRLEKMEQLERVASLSKEGGRQGRGTVMLDSPTLLRERRQQESDSRHV